MLSFFHSLILQALQPNGRPVRFEYAASMLNAIEGNNEYVQRTMYSDETIFYVTGYVNRHNFRIWVLRILTSLVNIFVVVQR